ncbi:MAG: aspartate kinase [Kiritimatiellia bacterium]|nr:aspartate kinase [Kiritimatiellia bacterium]MDP6630854.1 aspartate kinase [Kiritimatiellia bacterium]MDP6811267.1 aspartate kinase [Kiritimatiellia bacterium]MDP7024119.1 aspartate kinase [Kiritimatiellia bacterium]
MKVCKFGGSSLADAAQVAQVCDVVLADPDRRLVVVSAPGKRFKDDIKVTDLLIACANARLDGKPTDEALAVVVARYREIQETLGVAPAVMDAISENLATTLAGNVEHRERFMDAMKAAGEDNSARLVAAELQRRGTDARYLNPGDAGLLLSDEYGNARLLPESYDNLARLHEAEGITVFPGFFGYTREGEVVTFSRGGSDITGAILAAAVKAEVYENFTDVDFVCSIDPSLAENVKPITEMTYREMRELSYAGFNVLHDEAIIPAVHAEIPIRICNTNNPAVPGTLIVAEREVTHGAVLGIAGSGGFCSVLVSKYLMNREIGFGRRILQFFEEEGLSFEHMPSGVDNLSVVLREDELDTATTERIVTHIREKLGADSVSVEHGLALVMLVGEGMHYTVGVAMRATAALADANVNLEMIDQGSSELSIVFGIKEADRKAAMKALYEKFFE